MIARQNKLRKKAKTKKKLERLAAERLASQSATECEDSEADSTDNVTEHERG